MSAKNKWQLFFLNVFFFFQPALAITAMQCTVAGHGPYDENLKMCIYLGEQQAMTNCQLTDESATVEYIWGEKSGKVHNRGKCSSEYIKEKRQCKPAKCR